MEPELTRCLRTLISILNTQSDHLNEAINRLERLGQEQDKRLERFEKFFQDAKTRLFQDLIKSEIALYEKKNRGRVGKPRELEETLENL